MKKVYISCCNRKLTLIKGHTLISDLIGEYRCNICKRIIEIRVKNPNIKGD